MRIELSIQRNSEALSIARALPVDRTVTESSFLARRITSISMAAPCLHAQHTLLPLETFRLTSIVRAVLLEGAN